MITKEYVYYVIVTWKTGTVKVIRRKPKKLDSKYLMVPVRVKIKVPDLSEVDEISTERTITREQIDDAIIDNI